MFKENNRRDMENIESKMGNVIAEMVQLHNMKVETLKESHKNLLEEKSLLRNKYGLLKGFQIK